MNAIQKLNFKTKLLLLFATQFVGILFLFIVSGILVFLNKNIAYYKILNREFMIYFITMSAILLFNQWLFSSKVKKTIAFNSIKEKRKHLISTVILNLVIMEIISLGSFILFLFTANGAYITILVLVLINIAMRISKPQASKYYPMPQQEQMPKVAA